MQGNLEDDARVPHKDSLTSENTPPEQAEGSLASKPAAADIPARGSILKPSTDSERCARPEKSVHFAPSTRFPSTGSREAFSKATPRPSDTAKPLPRGQRLDGDDNVVSHARSLATSPTPPRSGEQQLRRKSDPREKDRFSASSLVRSSSSHPILRNPSLQAPSRARDSSAQGRYQITLRSKEPQSKLSTEVSTTSSKNRDLTLVLSHQKGHPAPQLPSTAAAPPILPLTGRSSFPRYPPSYIQYRHVRPPATSMHHTCPTRSQSVDRDHGRHGHARYHYGRDSGRHPSRQQRPTTATKGRGLARTEDESIRTRSQRSAESPMAEMRRLVRELNGDFARMFR